MTPSTQNNQVTSSNPEKTTATLTNMEEPTALNPSDPALKKKPISSPSETGAIVVAPSLGDGMRVDTSEVNKTNPARPSNRVALFMVLFSFGVLLTTSGVVFGYAAIKPVLISEGAYSHACVGVPNYDPKVGCTDQLLQLNLMIILVPVVMNVATLIGIAGDRFGPRFMSVLGTLIYSTGLIVLAFSSASFSGYLAGFCCLAFGGCTIFLAFLHLATLFPKRMGMINSMLNGAFDASTILMTMFKIVVDETGITLRILWLCCLTVPIMNIFFSFFFISPIPISYAPVENTAASVEKDSTIIEPQKKKRSGPPPLYNLQNLGWKQQLLSPELLLAIVFIAINEIRMIFYIATIGEQLTDMFGLGEHREKIANFFDLALPIQSLICVPLVGIILDRLGLIAIFWTVAVSQLISGALQLVPIWWIQMPQIMIFIFFRACLYAAVADYCGRMFGYATFGRTYAAIMCTSGLANIVSYGFDYTAKNVLNGSYFWINLPLTLWSPLTFVLPIYLTRKNRRIQRELKNAAISRTAPTTSTAAEC